MESYSGIPRNYVGMPAAIELDLWAADVRAVFGSTPYLVGSATRGREFRDVDVRVLLWPVEWDRFFPGARPTGGGGADHDRGWSALCAAFSAWGTQRTGLPIDFQVQSAEMANIRYVETKRISRRGVTRIVTTIEGRVPLGLDVIREVPLPETIKPEPVVTPRPWKKSLRQAFLGMEGVFTLGEVIHETSWANGSASKASASSVASRLKKEGLIESIARGQYRVIGPESESEGDET